MFDIHTKAPLLNRPICTVCNAFMRLSLVVPHLCETFKNQFTYACTQCDLLLENVVDPEADIALHIPLRNPSPKAASYLSSDCSVAVAARM
jgi:hypothetical protein